jgi:hypothetical protein
MWREKNGIIQNMKTLMNFPLQTNKRAMKNLLAKNLYILSMPWMKNIAHLQGKNPRKNFMKRVTNPLKRRKDYLVILLKTTKT